MPVFHCSRLKVRRVEHERRSTLRASKTTHGFFMPAAASTMATRLASMATGIGDIDRIYHAAPPWLTRDPQGLKSSSAACHLVVSSMCPCGLTNFSSSLVTTSRLWHMNLAAPSSKP
ncbi:MAG: NgoMIV family type II restriction endonuclease [Desulfomonilaceae bacterium]